MSNDIKIGDKVKLKSGGQEMIVNQYCHKGDNIDKTRVVCAWHNLLGDHQEQVYAVDTLAKV